MKITVPCSNCQIKNRIDRENLSSKQRPVCAKCWTELEIPDQYKRHDSDTKTSRKTKYSDTNHSNTTKANPTSNTGKNEGIGLWGWVGILFFGWLGITIYSANNDGGSSSNNTTRVETAYNSGSSAPSYPIVVKPYSGSVTRYTNQNSVAPLTVNTQGGSDYLIKLEDSYSGSTVLTMYIRGGSTESINVPLGTYRIKYATGNTWYGQNHLFGPDTRYSKANSSFTFQNTGYQITGYTLTLYSVANGNLSTSSINAGSF